MDRNEPIKELVEKVDSLLKRVSELETKNVKFKQEFVILKKENSVLKSENTESKSSSRTDPELPLSKSKWAPLSLSRDLKGHICCAELLRSVPGTLVRMENKIFH